MSLPHLSRPKPGIRPALGGLLLLVLSPLLAVDSSRAEDVDHQATYEDRILPLLEDYCLGCHSTRRKKAGLDLEQFKMADEVLQNRKVWSKVIHALRIREMPPENKDQPTEEERIFLAEWIEDQLDRLDCSGAALPGRVTVRRLNKNEYDHTIRDLLGVDRELSKSFPSDNVGYGFDNIGDVLSLPPLLLEKYFEAAETAIEIALEAQAKFFFRTRVEAEKARTAAETTIHDNRFLSINKEGKAFVVIDFPEKGEYEFRARAFGQQAGPEPPRMAFLLDGEEFHRVDIPVDDREPAVYRVRREVPAGKHEVAVAYLNNYNVQRGPDPALLGDRNLLVDWFEVELLRKPDATPPEKLEQRLIRRFPAARGEEITCATESLEPFLGRAFRRPVKPAELDRHVELVLSAIQDGESFESAMAMAFQAALISPHFLFRLEESDRAPSGDQEGKAETWIEPITPHDLASRLSYFLWSSMPDRELLELADSGKLGEEKVLRAQVRRLLADPRSRAFVENFAGQWLQMRNLEVVSPDPELFPDFDEELKAAMERETLGYFETILRENRSVLELLVSDYTLLNERLARHYGLEGIEGDGFRRVSLEGSSRSGGILTQASVLTITSNPRRTSPVKRGKWILEQVLGTPPPPPPPGVEELSEEPEAILSGSLRERMEKHRADPTCASCHLEMDSMGFALENFDPVGAWREFDGQFLIDPSGELPDGGSFEGPTSFQKLLLGRKEQFFRNFCEQLLTYALGRGLEYYDKCTVDRLIEVLHREEYKMGSLIEAIVLSEPFTQRTGGSP